MKNEKSPVLDGCTAEFLNLFLIDLEIFVIRSINKGYKIGHSQLFKGNVS